MLARTLQLFFSVGLPLVTQDNKLKYVSLCMANRQHAADRAYNDVLNSRMWSGLGTK